MKTMYKFFTAIEKLALLPLLFVSISSAQGVFITEIADPQNSADNGRFIELYNSGSADVDLSDGWFLVRWTNANVDIDEILDLSGIIPAGGFYIIANDAAKFNSSYSFDPNQEDTANEVL